MIAAASERLRGWLVPVALVLVAAALRLPNLATRGTWDSDQAHDMLVLRSLVRDGVVPLLGPPTSIGDVHHGAWYYYLLSPAAALTGGDSPLAVVLLIALAGIAAVVVTWWLARSIAGPVAGLVAGLAMAISPASVDESTFIWNPNPIGLSSAIALAAAWRAWTSRRAGWWLVAAIGTAITMQCHVLGVTLLPVVGALLVADLRRRQAVAERRAVLRVGLAGLGFIALSFLPLVIHELTTDFAEVQAALRFLRAGGGPPEQGPVVRYLLVEARVVSWPLVGLIVDAIAAAMVSLVVVLAIAVWRSIAGREDERTAARWLGLGLVWTALALTFAAPGLAVVIRGLPNDHYHAFADPMVFALVGMGAAALWRAGRAGTVPRAWAVAREGAMPRAWAVARAWAVPRVWAVPPSRVLAVAGVATIVAWAATHQPPAVHPDGGYPAAERAAQRIEASAGPGPIRLVSMPDFKPADAYAYPLVLGGRTVEAGGKAVEGEVTLVRADASREDSESLVVICDALFETVLGAPCGGPAEETMVPASLGGLIDRFGATPGRVISIYRVATP